MIENTLKGEMIKSSILGIGINVNQTKFETASASSVLAASGIEIQPNELIEKVLIAMEDLLPGSGKGEISKLKSKYLRRLYQYGKSAMYRDEKGIFEGKITGLDESGRILIKSMGRERRYDFKEVEFLNTSLS